jgi:hypothetical protein
MSVTRTKLLAECNTAYEAMIELGGALKDFDPDRINFTEVDPEEMPQPARQLLVHQKHMTKVLTGFYGRPMDLHVLDRHYDGGDLYHRKIMLTVQETDRIVEYGVVRLDFRCMSPVVKRAILEEHAPLGSILINHNVLRRVQPRWYLELPHGGGLLKWFGCPTAGPLYGRIGTIYCDGEPAIELLEVVTGIPV